MATGYRRIVPVLLSGGAGTRLWPLSRRETPKQFLPLTGETTLFQQTILRTADRALFDAPLVIAAAEQRFLVAEQLRVLSVDDATIVLEPSARNTAAAAAVAALHLARMADDTLLLLAPTDHRIDDVAGFHAAVRLAAGAAAAGHLTLFGIKPANPATGYGYIRMGAPLDARSGAFDVAAFVEKPDQATAARYVEDGGYLWNSGMALMPAAVLLAEFERHEPEILRHAASALDLATRDRDFLWLAPEPYARCPATSIDYGILERATGVTVLGTDFGWSDVGTWSALWEIGPRDQSGNVHSGRVIAESTRDSYLRSEGPMIATLGVSNLIVVATADAILVAAKERDQDIRKIVDRLRTEADGDTLQHL